MDESHADPIGPLHAMKNARKQEQRQVHLLSETISGRNDARP